MGSSSLNDPVVLTICFCDENCSTYNLIKQQETKIKHNARHCREFQDKMSADKKKAIDCRQRPIPISVNIINDSRNNKCQNIKRANGLQDCNLLKPKIEYGSNCDDTPKQEIDGSLLKPNIVVNINETEFKCSSSLLKHYSNFFNNLEIDPSCKIVLCGLCIKESIFTSIYTWMQMYIDSPQIILNENNVVDMLSTCLLLMIPKLELVCWEYICDKNKFKFDQLYKIYCRAVDIQFTQVIDTIFERVLEYFPILMNTKSFLESNLNQILPILKSDYLCCNSEMEIFVCCCKWLLFDESRMIHLTDLMDSVRFGLMNPQQLCCLHLNHNCLHITKVVNHSYTSKLIENAIVLNSLKNEYNYSSGVKDMKFWYKCNELGVKIPKERIYSQQSLKVCVCHK